MTNEKSFVDYYYDHRLVMTLTYGSVMIEVKWKDEDNLEQIEYFNFPEEIELSQNDIEEMVKNFLKDEREGAATLIRLESNENIELDEEKTRDITFYLSYEDDRLTEIDLMPIELESDSILFLLRKYPNIDKVTFHWQIPQIEPDTYFAKLVAEKRLGEFQYITTEFDPILIPEELRDFY